MLTGDVDTTTATGRLVFGIFATLAEFERDLIHERTMAGLAAARVRGRTGGRPRVMTKQKLKAAMAMMADRDNAARDVAAQLGVSLSTLYAYVDAKGQPREQATELLGKTCAEGPRSGAIGLISAGRLPYRQPNPRVRPVLRRTYTGPTRSPFPPRRHRSRVRGRAPRRP